MSVVRVVYYLAALATFVQTGSAQRPILRNGAIEALFNGEGLVSVRQVSSEAQLSLARDAWSITIDGTKLNSSDTHPVLVSSEPDERTYRFPLKDFEVEAIYRLKPDWKFVEKELRITRAPNQHFEVQRVVAWDVTVQGEIADDFTPSTYVPQFGKSIAESRKSLSGKDFGEFLRMANSQGAMFTVQNPFLVAQRDGARVQIAYDPDMIWEQKWGAFTSDAACLGVYRLSGQRLPREMVTEWHVPPDTMARDGMDRSEIAAFTDCVRAFLLLPAPDPVSVEVGWTLNDYQIDAGTVEGRAEYKHIIDVASDLGVKTLLYAPGNSQLAKRTNSADTWSWEYVLWLGLGEKIRKGEWDPAKDAIPASVTEMLGYARQKGIGLLAYVYPSVPFASNPAWLVRRSNDREIVPETGGAPQYATLASRDLQDYLIRNLIAFQKRTGVAGYSFDYTWLDLPGSSSYAQWYGWRRVMAALRKADPTIVIDGRQSYQLYGPWSWLAGSYPHPTGNDEQPESFRPFPDLHFDRVSADRTRFVNYWYRNYQFAPSEIIPGYATHQTERSRNVPAEDGHGMRAEMMYTRYRVRDWDLLGFKYSFLSSIATGGWNNVVDLIPARDAEERKHFSAQDKAWIRDWLEWTVRNREYLRHTRTILQQPALRHVDGTSAIMGDHGFVFVFNPNYTRMPAALKLDDRIGLTGGQRFTVRELYPQSGRLIGKPGAGFWTHGDTVPLELDGTSATVFEITPAPAVQQPLLFNAGGPHSGLAPDAKLVGTTLSLRHVAGEPGTVQRVGVLLPDATRVSQVEVNGAAHAFSQSGHYIETRVEFAGERFSEAQQISLQSSQHEQMTGSFAIPRRIFDQLAQRKEHWPIPWTPDDLQSTWLAPERLLLFVQMAEPRDTLTVTAEIDGKPLKLVPAYTSVRADATCFVGYYADVSNLAPDVRHTIALKDSDLAPGQLQGVFFDNVEPQWTEHVIVQATNKEAQ